MEQLQPVLDFVKASFMTSNDLLIQGVLIALVLGFIMSRMGQILIYLVVALVLDLFIVPLVRAIYADGWDVSGAAGHAKDIMDGLIAEPMFAAQRVVFFLITLIVVRLIMSVIRRS